MFVCYQSYLLSTKNAVKSRPSHCMDYTKYTHHICVCVSAGSLSADNACILIELGHVAELPYYGTLEGVLPSDVSSWGSSVHTSSVLVGPHNN